MYNIGFMKAILYIHCLFIIVSVQTSSKPFFAVVVCSFNNEKWCNLNLESIFMQKYDNYHVYYCDDASTDRTLFLVKSFIQEHDLSSKITIIENKERQYKLYNFYTIIHAYIPSDHIVVEIDGDDWLTAEDVFDYLADLYRYKNIWMTYGGFVAWPYTFSYLETQDIPDAIVKTNDFRSFYQKGFIFMALRTFYAGLFKKIHKKDLWDDAGKFFTRSSDVVTMIPMFEMAGDRFYHIEKQCYCYNTDTGINDYTQDKALQNKIYNIVRNREKYYKLKKL